MGGQKRDSAAGRARPSDNDPADSPLPPLPTAHAGCFQTSSPCDCRANAPWRVTSRSADCFGWQVR